MRCEHLREFLKAWMVAECGNLLSNQDLTARRRLTEASLRHDEGRRFNRLGFAGLAVPNEAESGLISSQDKVKARVGALFYNRLNCASGILRIGVPKGEMW